MYQYQHYVRVDMQRNARHNSLGPLVIRLQRFVVVLDYLVQQDLPWLLIPVVLGHSDSQVAVVTRLMHVSYDLPVNPLLLHIITAIPEDRSREEDFHRLAQHRPGWVLVHQLM